MSALRCLLNLLQLALQLRRNRGTRSFCSQKSTLLVCLLVNSASFIVDSLLNNSSDNLVGCLRQAKRLFAIVSVSLRAADGLLLGLLRNVWRIHFGLSFFYLKKPLLAGQQTLLFSEDGMTRISQRWLWTLVFGRAVVRVAYQREFLKVVICSYLVLTQVGVRRLEDLGSGGALSSDRWLHRFKFALLLLRFGLKVSTRLQ